MKTSHLLCSTGVSAVAAFTCFTSCIFDDIDDMFDETVWTCENVPLGPYEVSEMTVEFYTDGEVSMKLTGVEYAPETPTVKTIHGTYYTNGNSAILQKLSATYDSYNITFIQADMNCSTLFLIWKVNGSEETFTTTMRRMTGK